MGRDTGQERRLDERQTCKYGGIKLIDEFVRAKEVSLKVRRCEF